MKVNQPFEIGSNMLIRTVTMIFTGKLEAVYEKEIVISSAAWIPETERWTVSVAKGEFREIEPYPKDAKVIIGRGSIIDAVAVSWKLPLEQK